MTDSEFEYFYAWSLDHQTTELMEEMHISRETATRQAAQELSRMLPHGIHTKHNYFMTILAGEHRTNVGFIWTIHEQCKGRKQSFLCDFAIWEPERRKGYGLAALRLAEKMAIEADCQESVLFVTERNEAANALYQKCGYQFLRQEKYGRYMIKQLL